MQMNLAIHYNLSVSKSTKSLVARVVARVYVARK